MTKEEYQKNKEFAKKWTYPELAIGEYPSAESIKELVAENGIEKMLPLLLFFSYDPLKLQLDDYQKLITICKKFVKDFEKENHFRSK